MSNVLTIDFDLIMAPSIELYNDIIGDEEGINEVIQKYPLLEYTLTADFFIYEALTRGLMILFKKIPADNVYFISNHQDIIPIVGDLEKFSLINIDHHHDIAYGSTKPTSFIRQAECGNWVKYLSDLGKIKEYIWIHNKNSIMPKIGFSKPYLYEDLEIQTIDFNKFENIDKLVICNSPHWVPPNVQALFMTWIGIAEEYYGKNFEIL